MNHKKLCTDPECRSRVDRRLEHCKQLCQNCYMKKRRNEEKNVKRYGQKELITASHEAFQAFAHRSFLSTRRRHVRKLLDQGRSAEEVIFAFSPESDLHVLVADLRDPIKDLKRDIKNAEVEDRSKSNSQKRLERQVRQTRAMLEDLDLAARERARLYIHLHSLESELEQES